MPGTSHGLKCDLGSVPKQIQVYNSGLRPYVCPMEKSASSRHLGRMLFFGGLIIVATLAAKAGEGRYKGPVTDHFDGSKFHNLVKDSKGFFDLVKWMTNRDQGKWPDWVDAKPGPPPPKKVGDGPPRITLVNHSTVLIQIDGVNILTDPQWSMRASPVPFAGPKRVRAPGIRFEDLPPIDVVLVSHDHYDHMDIPTLRRLRDNHNPLFIAGLGTAAYWKGKNIDNAFDLDWWEKKDVSDEVAVHAVPARHFAQRRPGDGNTRLWCGFIIQGRNHKIYFAGDTGFGPHFELISLRFPDIDMALLPIGAYRPRWFMSEMHIDPRQALEAMKIIGAKKGMAMHYGTFPLADDGYDEPLKELEAALQESDLPRNRFWVLDFGYGRSL